MNQQGTLQAIQVRFDDGVKTFASLAQLWGEAKARHSIVLEKRDDLRAAYRALGQVLIELRGQTPDGAWGQALRLRGISRNRASRAMREAGGTMDGLDTEQASKARYHNQDRKKPENLVPLAGQVIRGGPEQDEPEERFELEIPPDGAGATAPVEEEISEEEHQRRAAEFFRDPDADLIDLEEEDFDADEHAAGAELAEKGRLDSLEEERERAEADLSMGTQAAALREMRGSRPSGRDAAGTAAPPVQLTLATVYSEVEAWRSRLAELVGAARRGEQVADRLVGVVAEMDGLIARSNPRA